MSQLPSDCLNEIFEYLEEDKATLHSCLLVNRLWCEVSVRILWKNIRNYNTLIACLPNDSKEILSKNGIVTSTPASRPPMFNYASFCKVLSTHQVNKNIRQLLCNYQQYTSLQKLKNLSKVTREIFKFLIAQTSLRVVDLPPYSENNQEFTSIPGVMGCLGNLSELTCGSDICSCFFYQLSQTCHNIQSLNIEFVNIISNGLADLISAQQNLKALTLELYDCEDLTADIITSLTNLPDTLIKLNIRGENYAPMLLSFISNLANLQEMILSFNYDNVFEDFEELQYVTFSQLQILKFQYACPRYELLTKFLENNGKNLKEFYADYYNNNNSLNLTIAKFCPNLRKLFTGFRNDEIETLKTVLDSCQYLESIQVWCCDDYLSEEKLFEIFVKCSPKNFHELKLCYSFDFESELLPEELDTFFTSWTNRTPQKSLSLTIICNDSDTLDNIDGNMEIIEKYIRLGIVNEFKSIKHYFDDF